MVRAQMRVHPVSEPPRGLLHAQPQVLPLARPPMRPPMQRSGYHPVQHPGYQPVHHPVHLHVHHLVFPMRPREPSPVPSPVRLRVPSLVRPRVRRHATSPVRPPVRAPVPSPVPPQELQVGLLSTPSFTFVMNSCIYTVFPFFFWVNPGQCLYWALVSCIWLIHSCFFKSNGTCMWSLVV